MKEFPKNFDHQLTEARLGKEWEESQIYKWDKSKPREQTFVVDTPPPTVSGSLHIGHVFSYTQTDLIVRYQRMLGKNIMYPMGWDDNGLPTERRVENVYEIRCNSRLPYDPSLKFPIEKKPGEFVQVSRGNFIEACAQVTGEDEKVFEEQWRQLGLSLDWTQTYATIDDHCRKTSQLSFLDLLEKGYVYSSESPTMWDVDFQTALAQADLEDRLVPGAYHDIEFKAEDGTKFIISTTRPELLVAIIAVVAHPDDKRYQKMFGKNAITPLFGAKVPILASEHADPEKGSGVMMVCTFGDSADVDWWKTSGLPIKQVIGKDGKFIELDFANGPFQSIDPEKAKNAYSKLIGKRAANVQKEIVLLLKEEGSAVDGKGTALKGEPKKIEHAVKFYEKGQKPIEYVTTRQWFINILDYKKELLEQGGKINWFPAHMRSRYDHWVEGLAHDWCISRQRYFGVAFPVWYPISSAGEVEYNKPIFADKKNLPVDPLVDCPQGFKEESRNQPGGFCGDPDVMDTWATSSLTPQIVSQWASDDQKRHQKLFPMDIRPQAHEIIRTWAFYTIAKAWMHHREIPWKNIIISGWILDPDRKKMSKSKGNVVTPKHLLDEYSADGVRYWAARARLGVDTAFDQKVFANGRKLANKIFNASKFVLSQIDLAGSGEDYQLLSIVEESDLAMIEKLRRVIAKATESFEKFEYAAALQVIEDEFWQFCDLYLELVKARAYSDENLVGKSSAVATLSYSLQTFLKLFAPFMPYITDEVWSWLDNKGGKSVHVAEWPKTAEIKDVPLPKAENLLEIASELLGGIRFEKSKQQKTLKWPVSELKIQGSKENICHAKYVIKDVVQAGKVESEKAVTMLEKKMSEGPELFAVEVRLSEELPN